MPWEGYFTEHLIDATDDTLFIPTLDYSDRFSGSVEALKFLMGTLDKVQGEDLHEARWAMDKAVERQFEEIIGRIDFGAKIKSIFLRDGAPKEGMHFGVRYEKYIVAGDKTSREIGYEPLLDARIVPAESIIEKKEGEPVKGYIIVARAYLDSRGAYADFITRCLLLSFPSDPRYGKPAVSREHTGWYNGHLNVMPVLGVKKVLGTAKEIYGVLSIDKPFEDVYEKLDADDSGEKFSFDELLSEVRRSRRLVKTLRALGRTV